MKTIPSKLEKKILEALVVLYAGKDVIPFGKNMWAIPLHILWQ